MYPTLRLFAPLTTHLTFFTRASCQLCANARETLSLVWEKEPFEYTEVDVMKPEASAQAKAYEFDVPVVHVSRADWGKDGGDGGEGKAKGKVEWMVMHKIVEEEVVRGVKGVREGVEREMAKAKGVI